METNGSAPREPLPEAPASATFRYVHPSGFEVMLTLRDFNGTTLLGKVDAAIAHLERQGCTPTPAAGKGSTKPAQGDGSAPLCPTHNKPMKQSQHRPGEWFCSVRIADDDGAGRAVYCKQKVKL